MTSVQKSTSTLGRATSFMVKKLWTLFAIVLVVVALFMSLLRYSLPFLNDHKEYVENYIADNYAVEVKIGELSASWQSQGPAIVLRNLRVKNGPQSPVFLNIGEVFLEVDFWPSIIDLKLRSNQVKLNGLALSIDTTRFQSASADFPIVDALENVFLEQLSNFIVSDSRLTLITQETNKVIDITRLSWLNKDKRHQGVGEFVLEDFSDNSASFILDLYGTVDSYSGTLFARAQDIDLSPWINEYTGFQSQLASSKGNVEIWTKIENGEFKRIDGQVLPSTFEWRTEESSINNTVSAKFAAIKGPDQWNFSVANLKVDIQDSAIVSNVHGYFAPKLGFVISLPEVTSLKPLLAYSGLVSLSVADTLALINADATLQGLQAKLDSSGFTLQAKVEDIAWQEHNEVVGIDGLHARVYLQDKRGKVVLSAKNTKLHSQYYFSRSMAFDKLYLPIEFDIGGQDQRGALVTVREASADIDGLLIGLNTEYAPKNAFLSLAVDIDEFEAAKVPSLLPKYLVGQGTKRFLTNAFMGAGKVVSANVMWHGSLNAFPFADNSGIFQSNVSVTQADFSFSKGWPALSQLDIDLFFENQSLRMKSSGSFLDKVALSNLQAEIPELKANALLTITADGAATSNDITSLMMQSSLANSLGQLLNNDVVVDGDLSTKLSLFIPLVDGTKPRVKGDVYFDDNKVAIPALNIAFNNAKGMLRFENETIAITDMQASFLGQDIDVRLNGEKSDDKYALKASLLGDWEVRPLAQQIGSDFADYFEGNTSWEFDLALDLMAEDFTYVATLRSNLLGVSAQLPQPLAKFGTQALPLTLNARGSRVASSIDLSLGEVLKFDGALAHKEKQFNRAHLAVGPTELESRGLGFSISGNFETLYVDTWYPFVKAITSELGTSKTPLIGLPQRIFIDTQKLEVAGQTFNDVDVTVKRLTDQWSFDIDANELRGNVSLFDQWFSKGLVIDAEYIRITQENSISALEPKTLYDSYDIDPKSFPSINFTCKACDIKGINLGRVELEAEPNNDGLKISQLMINNEFGNVNSSGQWYQRNDDHYTFIAGDLNSNDFGEFISQLGFDSGIKDSSASLSFQLDWLNSPMDIDLQHLNGSIDWQLSDGYLAEVSDKGSRIFTLLSLSSLVRKLSLDFRDVFAKGFFYDNMRGSVQIAQGIADTRDTLIDGAAGEIEIYGNTDLVNQKLNYNVSFTPNVTGNLPVLVYFLVSPPTALAALAIDQVLTSAKVISNINYSVTGTIKEPILIETGRESTEVDLPASRENLPEEELPPFVPPTEEDLIEIEVKDGIS